MLSALYHLCSGINGFTCLENLGSGGESEYLSSLVELKLLALGKLGLVAQTPNLTTVKTFSKMVTLVKTRNSNLGRLGGEETHQPSADVTTDTVLN